MFGEINGKEYVMFVKYGKKENLQKLQEGYIYMKQCKFYRDLEKKSGSKGMGDLWDGCIVSRNIQVSINGVILPKPDSITQTCELDERTPIFCLSYYTRNDFQNETGKLKISNIKKIRDEFGEYALVIPYPIHFIKKIGEQCELEQLDFRFKEVQYQDMTLSDNNWHNEYENDLSHFWIKDLSFKGQKEFRMLLANVMVDKDKDFYQFKVEGGFKDFTCLVPVEKLATIELKDE